MVTLPPGIPFRIFNFERDQTQKRLPPFKRVTTVKQKTISQLFLLVSARRRSSAYLPEHASDDLGFVRTITMVKFCAPDGNKIIKLKAVN